VACRTSRRVSLTPFPALGKMRPWAAIIPHPAFADNYVWLLREGRAAVVVDPGDAAPVQAYLDREGPRPRAIVATPPSRAGSRRRRRSARGAPACAGLRSRAGTIPARTRALARGDAVVLGETGGSSSSCSTCRGNTAGHIAYTGAWRMRPCLLWRHAVCRRCGRIFEGTRRRCGRRCRSSRRSIPPPGCSARTEYNACQPCTSRPCLSPPTLRWRSAAGTRRGTARTGSADRAVDDSPTSSRPTRSSARASLPCARRPRRTRGAGSMEKLR